ncbi:hypothetical protein GBW32_11440 [Streptomyces tsukubensis]|uniref:DUF559 domain-containing protein n=1 Tax=Streptomyces tsukubensis TaxID=83656 RepID=A0A1V4ACK8_9ACTN|nr:hypothetical protein B1H18_10225 [Streptomyces tsukubensis]QFR97670.1 hypothetical protein GBW32_11440 [Streptomyces tsukubensis]
MPQQQSGGPERVLSAAQLKAKGVSSAEAAGLSGPGRPWQRLLPGVFLLRPGPPTSEERLHAALLYAGRPPAGRRGAVPVQPSETDVLDRYAEAMVTGLAALTLHGFSSTPTLSELPRFDVLVPHTRRLRSTGFVRIVRGADLPVPQRVTGVSTAPVARAVADAVAELTDAATVDRLLTEAVRGGHCDPAAVLAELRKAGLLSRPCVLDAADALLAEGRAIAEERLYSMVFEGGLPDPVWNVELRLPGGPCLGTVDAYWPEQAVAVELDTRVPAPGGGREKDAAWGEYARKREQLERLGVTVVHITPRKLREALDQQACVVRTALTAAADREPAEYVAVLPR